MDRTPTPTPTTICISSKGVKPDTHEGKKTVICGQSEGILLLSQKACVRSVLSQAVAGRGSETHQATHPAGAPRALQSSPALVLCAARGASPLQECAPHNEGQGSKWCCCAWRPGSPRQHSVTDSVPIFKSSPGTCFSKGHLLTSSRLLISFVPCYLSLGTWEEVGGVVVVWGLGGGVTDDADVYKRTVCGLPRCR